MALHLKTGLKQLQTLRLTPQLQQAIKLLQLSRMELETEVRKEIEENPVLEDFTEEDVQAKTAQESPQNQTEVQGEPDIAQMGQDPQKQDEFEWENYLDSQYKPMPSQGGFNNEEIMNYENLISTSQSLLDYLVWQAQLTGYGADEVKYVMLLINYVDDDGYIKTPLEEIASLEKVDLVELEEAIGLVQEFDPPGVGARDLKECLLLQAKAIQEDTKDLVLLLENHLKDLEKKNYDGIARAMNTSLEEVIELSKIIYEMDPRPGRKFAPQDTHYVTPDVYVYKVGDDYVVSLNEDGLPKLRISNFYRNILKAEAPKRAADPAAPQDKKKVTQDYIQDKLKSAVWLIKAIHQRQRTIYRVTESIVKHQRDFFEKGPAHLRPMILRDIASDIGMHESTISRVTTNKYVHTPRGIFELKYFFNSGISKTDGDSLASESIKLKIKDLVEKEDGKDPLSDQKIVEILKREGIEIARRTVAKYRDVLGILPSSRRKKFF